MKLLFDQNLSPRLCKWLADLFPDSKHILDIGLDDSTDTEIWEYAKANGFAVVSKDADFQLHSLLSGHPPKFIWVRIGNCTARQTEDLLRRHSITIHTFNLDDTRSFLQLL